jgi:hypothetical protein
VLAQVRTCRRGYGYDGGQWECRHSEYVRERHRDQWILVLRDGATMFSGQKDIGQEESGYEIALVYFVTLALAAIDESELLISSKLSREKQIDGAPKSQVTSPDDTIQAV